MQYISSEMGYGVIFEENIKNKELIIRANLYDLINSEDIGF